MEFVKDTYNTLRGMNKRQLMLQFVSLGLIVTSALMIWKFLVICTGSESPVVVVLSGSMEPAFYRGDILLLNVREEPVQLGEIVVFNVDGRDVPIVHRVVRAHARRADGHIELLTKGDHNYGDDKVLYAPGQDWLHLDHIMGRTVGFVPKIGMVTIIMNDYPIVKYLLIGILGLMVVTSKD